MKKLFNGVLLAMVLASFLGASSASYQADKTDKVNAKLHKGAIVCKTKRSVNYLLRSESNYQKVLDGLVSNNFYKNCFLSITKAKVKVVAHYSSKKLIKNYYVLNLKGNQKRYVPIEFLEPLHLVKKNKSKRRKAKKKRYVKKSRYTQVKRKKVHKVKRYTQKRKSKVIHKKKKIHEAVKANNIYAEAEVSTTNTIMNPDIEDQTKKLFTKIQKSNINDESQSSVSPTIVIPEIKDEIAYETEKKDYLKTVLSSYSEPKVNTSSNHIATPKENVDYRKVYRCSAVSFDKSFSGEHANKEKSKKMAMTNCKKYQKSKSICVLEDCFILRISLH